MKYFLSTLFALTTLLSSAQLFEVGVRGGVNLFDIEVKDFEDPNMMIESVESGDRKLGYHFGAYGRLNLPFFFVQPELLYTFQNSEITYTDNGGSQKSLEIDYSRFDVPVLVGTKLGPVRFGLGPVATFAINSPDGAFNKSLKDATFGYQLGVGLDLGPLRIEARYEGPLSNLANEVVIDGQTYRADARSNMIMIGLGYNFL